MRLRAETAGRALVVCFLALWPLAVEAQPHPPTDGATENLMENEASLSDVSIDTFVERLDAHGEWLDTAEHGMVWRPDVEAADWRPYSDGRWLHLDGLGWYWRSNEPWGWATDHYGRWVHEPSEGWLWRPEFEWAPAWVLWVETEDMIGWAALPPLELEGDPGPDAWVFVARKDFVAEDLAERIDDASANRDHLLQAKAFGAVTVEDGMASNTFVDPDQFGDAARIDAEEVEAAMPLPTSPEAQPRTEAVQSEESEAVVEHYEPPLAPEAEVLSGTAGAYEGEVADLAGEIITGTVSAEATASGGASAHGRLMALRTGPDAGARERRQAWEERLRDWDESVDGPFPRPEWR